MRQILKIIQFFILILLISTALFYYWAHQETQAEKLLVFNYPENESSGSDSVIGFLAYNMGYLSGMDNNLAIKTPEKVYRHHLNEVIKELDHLHVDIAAFQEIDYNSKRSYNINQHEEIASRFFKYSIQAINWDKHYVPFPYWPPSAQFGKMLSGQSTMCNWELDNTERIVLSKVESNPFYYNDFYLKRLAVVSLVKHPLKTFWLINVHTEAFDQPTRKVHIEKLHSLFMSKLKDYPVVMLGDFNSSPDFESPAIEIFLNDTTIGNAAFNIDNYENSFPSENPVERLDYIFYSKADFEEIDGAILQNFKTASDHLPVYAKLKIRP
ncbi:endonuclease/exonuclease/phosphatase family protein [Sunxiuqinia sp. A32]|uniref:endonuclease/exonuclease/phosphatase family protein n=1 Tax=Sunxiuqinia sp. A32 TaxID=3461496 RepID=UPI00404531F4